MTAAEWLLIRVGDVIVDHKLGDVERVVLEVSRVSGQRGQRRGMTRTTVHVTNLKSKDPSVHTILWASDDRGAARFSLRRRP